MSNKNLTLNSDEINFPEDYIPAKALSNTETGGLAGDLDEKINSNKRKIFKILGHLKALKRYMLDKNKPWFRKSIVVAAILYFIVPIDAMPDIVPLMGYLDDIGVIAWTIKFLGSEITEYYD